MTTASIVTYLTDAAELMQCLDRLNGAVSHIWVVDNSPSDALGQCCSVRDNVSYIHLPDNPGYGRAHNRALRLALAMGADYHLVLNSDVTFGSGVIDRIVRYMDTAPEVVQLIPRVLCPDGRDQASVRLLPTPLDVFGRRFLPARLMARRNARYTLASRDYTRELDVAYHQGCFMMLRTQALRKAGLFDERYFLYPEDIDLTRRMHNLGRTLYWPEVTVTHAHRAASYHSLRMLAVHCVNMIRYFNKWGWWHDPSRRAINRRILADIQRHHSH